jgi:ABC-2 type transport system ATP-binding protein
MIAIKELTKVYKETNAVDHITLEISDGEVLGLLGPNGAGKTTLILMLSTLLEPTSGKAIVNGIDIKKSPQYVKRNIGIMFQETSLDERLTGYENLEMQAALYDMPKSKRAERIEEMLDFVGLIEWSTVEVARYSGGMKRRLEIARCLIHKPKVLLLDEPTLGLDPKARETVWRYLERFKGLTVVLATNYIEEAESLCHRIAIINSGRVVAIGTPDELKSSLKRDQCKITTKYPETITPILEELPYVNNLRATDSKISFTIKKGKRKEFLAKMAGYELDSIEVHKPTLNDAFFQHTGRSIEIGLDRPTNGRGLGKKRKKR